MPDREQRFAAMLDVVEAVVPSEARILDLAGGTGSISIRVLRRLPAATTTLVDVDPVLLAVAEGSLDQRTTIVNANLRFPEWLAALPHNRFDAILSATALHWIPSERLSALYEELHGILNPGGVFINVDHMADEDLHTLTDRIDDHQNRHRKTAYATGGAISWESWWDLVKGSPELAPRFAKRQSVFEGLHAAEFSPPSSWHLAALRKAGFSEAGLIWRGGSDAAVAATP